MTTQMTSPLFDLLVALASGPQHGYALMLRVESMHNGAYRPSPGVVYSNLQRGQDAGWVEEVVTAEDGDGRRRQFRLTQAGAQAVKAHAQMLRQTADQALEAIKGAGSC